ncbi:MAG: periplasmic heavy metal sensor [Alphaproteobacteria bacterium]
MKLRLRHLLGIALLVSIGVNVLLAGIVIGRWVDHGPHGDGIPRFDREAAREALSPEARAIADEVWEQHKAAVRGKFKAVKEARNAVEALLRADEVDRATLEAAQAEMTTRWAEARAEIARGVTEVALALPADQRKLYFKAGETQKPWDQRRPPPPPDAAGEPPPPPEN